MSLKMERPSRRLQTPTGPRSRATGRQTNAAGFLEITPHRTASQAHGAPQPLRGTCSNCAWARACRAGETYIMHPDLTRMCQRVPTFAPELGDQPVEVWFTCHGWRHRRRAGK
jgi:hypothetical protein